MKRISYAILGGLILGWIAIYVIKPPRDNTAFMFDFPGFYAPAVILNEYSGARLYDFQLQADIENKYWPELKGTTFRFVYPPFYAAALSPLSFFGPQSAKVVLSLLMLISLFGVIRCGREFIPIFREAPLFSLAYLVSLFPNAVSIVGAQNMALTLLLYTAGAASIIRGSKRGEIFGGFLFGLLFYKPQFGIVVAASVLFLRRRNVILGYLLSAALLYAVGAIVMGLNWPIAWIQIVTQFGTGNMSQHAHIMISLQAMVENVRKVMCIDDSCSGVFKTIYYVISGVIFICVSQRFYKAGTEEDPGLSKSARAGAFSLLAPAIILLGQQSLFYDFGIAFLGILPRLKLNSDRAVLVVLALSLCAFLCLSFNSLTSPNLLSLAVSAQFLLILLR